jgi:hypothetical protein
MSCVNVFEAAEAARWDSNSAMFSKSKRLATPLCEQFTLPLFFSHCRVGPPVTVTDSESGCNSKFCANNKKMIRIVCSQNPR